MSTDRLKTFLDFPVALFYAYLDDKQQVKYNVMTNGAWTWYWYSSTKFGTINEIGNHGYTYTVAKYIFKLSMVFYPPTDASVLLLKDIGSTHGNEVDKLGTLSSQLSYRNEFVVHVKYPTWCLRPIDVHSVQNMFAVISTQLESAYNGWPTRRICDEDRKFYELVKKPIQRSE